MFAANLYAAIGGGRRALGIVDGLSSSALANGGNSRDARREIVQLLPHS